MSWQNVSNHDRVGDYNTTGGRQSAKNSKRTRSPSSNMTRFQNENDYSTSNHDIEFRQPQQQSNDGSPWQAMKRLRVAEQLREDNNTAIAIDAQQQHFRNGNNANIMYPTHHHSPLQRQRESTTQQSQIYNPVQQQLMSQNSYQQQQQQPQMEQYENVNRVLGNLHQQRMHRANHYHTNTNNGSNSMQPSSQIHIQSDAFVSNDFNRTESIHQHQREYQHQQSMLDNNMNNNQQIREQQIQMHQNRNNNEYNANNNIWNHENQQLQRLDRRHNGQVNSNYNYPIHNDVASTRHNHLANGSNLNETTTPYDLSSQRDYQGRKRKVVRLFTSSNLG